MTVDPLWYSEEERRRRWPGAAATHGRTRGGAAPRRRAAWLVARGLVCEYATLLPGPPRVRAGAGAPGAAGSSAQRGCGD